jgi:hypothetical protein
VGREFIYLNEVMEVSTVAYTQIFQMMLLERSNKDCEKRRVEKQMSSVTLLLLQGAHRIHFSKELKELLLHDPSIIGTKEGAFTKFTFTKHRFKGCLEWQNRNNL